MAGFTRPTHLIVIPDVRGTQIRNPENGVGFERRLDSGLRRNEEQCGLMHLFIFNREHAVRIFGLDDMEHGELVRRTH